MPAPMRRVFLVVCNSWGYDDEWWTGDDTPVKAFTQRGAAEEYIARCEEDNRAWEEANWGAQVDTRYTIVEIDAPV